MKETTKLVAPTKAESTVIRFPKGVLAQLSKAAAQSGRSRNSEIVYRLVNTLQQKKAAGS